MKKEKILVVILVLLLTSVAGIALVTTVRPESSALTLPKTEPKMELTHERFVEREQATRKAAASGELTMPEFIPSGMPVSIGEEFVFTVSDDGLGVDYDETFVVVLDGSDGIILIPKDAYESLDVAGYYHFANPVGDDSYLWHRSEDLIHQLRFPLQSAFGSATQQG